jgi:formylglycine-generating enzyme required for sulfatase activity
MNDNAPIDFRLVIEQAGKASTYKASLVSGPNKESIHGLEPMTFDASALIALAKERGKSFEGSKGDPARDAQSQQEVEEEETHWLTDFDNRLQTDLGELHKRLAEYRKRSDIRLWIEAPEELQELPFEAIGGFAELGRWQVIRDVSSRTGGARGRDSHPPSLTKVLIVIGDVSQEAFVPQSAASALAVVRELASVRVADTPLEVVVLCARSTYDAAPSEWEGLKEPKVCIFTPVWASEFVQYIRQHADANALVILAHGERSHSNDASAGSGDGANAFRLVRKSASKSDDALLTASRLAEALGSASRVRLALLLACEAQYAMVAALPTIDHVIGFLAPIKPASAQAVAARLFQSFARPGTATVGAAVREARAALDDHRLPHNGDLCAWCLAHWATADRDAPFIDRHAQVVAKANAATANQYRSIDNEKHGARSRLIDDMAVQLSVRRNVDGARTAEHAAFDVERRQSSVDFRWLVFGDAQDGTPWRLRGRTSVVRGGPGSGKTTSCRSLARELACGDLGLLVVYVRLVELAERLNTANVKTGKSTGLESIALHAFETTALSAQGLDFKSHYWPAFLAHSNAGRLVLFLDGLDEVQNANVQRSLRELIESLQHANGAEITIVVTSRPSAVLEIRGADDIAEILPLNRPQQVELLARWRRAHGTPDSEAAAQGEKDLAMLLAGDRSARLQGLFRVPLFLAMAARRLSTGKGFTAQRVHEFLDDAALDLLEGAHRRGSAALLPQGDDSDDTWRDALRDQLPLFERLAFRLTQRGQVDVDREQALALLVESSTDANEVARVASALEAWRRDPADKPRALAAQFLDAACRSGLFAPRNTTWTKDDKRGPWGFVHQQFQESLTSRLMARGNLTSIELTVSALVADLRAEEVRAWYEPLALLTSRLLEQPSDLADRWIDYLFADGRTREAAWGALSLSDAVGASTLVRLIRSAFWWYEKRRLYSYLALSEGNAAEEVVQAVLQQSVFAARVVREHLQPSDGYWARAELELAASLLDRLGKRLSSSKDVRSGDSIVSALTIPERTRVVRETMAKLPLLRHFVGQLPWRPTTGSFAWAPTLEPNGQRAGVPWLAPIVAAGERVRFRMGFDGPRLGRPEVAQFMIDDVEVGPYWIARTPITVAQFERLTRRTSYQRLASNVIACKIDWYSARLYCRWLTLVARRFPEVLTDSRMDATTLREMELAAEGLSRGTLVFRLPKESEWELAARGRMEDGNIWYGEYGRTYDSDREVWAPTRAPDLQGDGPGNRVKLEEIATFGGDYNDPWPQVATKTPTTRARLYDMHGGVFEWCLDAYGDLENVRSDEAVEGSFDSYRVLRGGSYRSFDWQCRTHIRASAAPHYEGNHHWDDDVFGFRVVLAPPVLLR